MQNIIQNNIELSVNIVVNKLNYNSLTKTVEFLNNCFKNKINNLNFSYVQPHGLAENNKEIVEKYSITSKAINLAMHYCKKNYIPFINPNCGIPLCFIKEFKDYSSDYIEYKNNGTISQDNSKTKTIYCNNCKQKSACYGIWKKYLDMYGDEEFKNNIF
jgi:hypothetical protein